MPWLVEAGRGEVLRGMAYCRTVRRGVLRRVDVHRVPVRQRKGFQMVAVPRNTVVRQV